MVQFVAWLINIIRLQEILTTNHQFHFIQNEKEHDKLFVNHY